MQLTVVLMFTFNCCKLLGLFSICILQENPTESWDVRSTDFHGHDPFEMILFPENSIMSQFKMGHSVLYCRWGGASRNHKMDVSCFSQIRIVRTRLMLCQYATCNASNGDWSPMFRPLGDLAVGFSLHSLELLSMPNVSFGEQKECQPLSWFA
jgi:hypothetical protein